MDKQELADYLRGVIASGELTFTYKGRIVAADGDALTADVGDQDSITVEGHTVNVTLKLED